MWKIKLELEKYIQQNRFWLVFLMAPLRHGLLQLSFLKKTMKQNNKHKKSYREFKGIRCVVMSYLRTLAKDGSMYGRVDGRGKWQLVKNRSHITTLQNVEGRKKHLLMR